MRRPSASIRRNGGERRRGCCEIFYREVEHSEGVRMREGEEREGGAGAQSAAYVRTGGVNRKTHALVV